MLLRSLFSSCSLVCSTKGSENNGDRANLTTCGANSIHSLTLRKSECTFPFPQEHIKISSPGRCVRYSHVSLWSQSRHRSTMAGNADFQVLKSASGDVLSLTS